MCKFFSFVGDGYGNFHAIGWETRKKWLTEGSDNLPDSHTQILTTMGVPPRLQDRWSKYEYNPLTRAFNVDEPVARHDHEAAERWANNLDYKRVVEPLIIKPIVHPFKLAPALLSKIDIENLHKWDSVGDSVRDSVGDSAGGSVGGYISSFFAIKYKYDFSPAISLWERGFVPSFDGKTWRLHSAPDGRVVYEMEGK